MTIQIPLEELIPVWDKVFLDKDRIPCEGSLLEFVDYVWPVIEPSRGFVTGWVVEAICEHLQAVTDGQIRRLLINVPPGFTKSTLVGVMWPAWEWGPKNMPSTRYICASYSEHLSVRDNMRCKNIVMSDRYQKLWGDRFQIAPDLMSKIKFGNTKTGWKLATSVGGVGVGERGDRFIIDDPHNTMEMESQTSRDTTKMWFTEVVPDRLNNQQTSAIVIIMQRLHEDDVSGTAIARNMGYEHLMIPMLHDTARHCVTSIGWEDPRTEEDELAWPERFPQHTVEELERDKGPYAFASQYQQSPEPRGGSIIKRDYWKPWEASHYPPCEYILASLDTAYTTKESNDPSALTVWGVFREDADLKLIQPLITPIPGSMPIGTDYEPRKNVKVILLYAWRKRLEFNDLVQAVMHTCTKDKKGGGFRFPVDRVIVEAKASGISVAQELRRLCGLTGDFGVELIKLKGNQDKVARLHSVQHLFAEGMVYAPFEPVEQEWRDFSSMVIDEVAIFPHGSHDDLVDSTSMAMRYLRDNGFMVRAQEKELDDDEEMVYRGRQLPLYPV